jgi:hypothetical protein
MKKKYPGRRTFAQWALLPYKERHAWVTQEQCNLPRLWAACARKRRCRRYRACRGDQFDCYWRHRETLSPAERARDDARFAPLQALLAIGPKPDG